MDNNKNNIHLISSKEDVEDDITYTCKITFIDKSFEIIENVLYFGSSVDNVNFLIFGTIEHDKENIPPTLVREAEVRKIETFKHQKI